MGIASSDVGRRWWIRCDTTTPTTENRALLHQFGVDQGFLGIMEDMGECIVPMIEIAAMDSDRLFSHRRLVGISGRLIVIGERNTIRHHSQNQTRMDFAVCIGILVQGFIGGGNEYSRCFVDIDVIDMRVIQD